MVILVMMIFLKYCQLEQTNEFSFLLDSSDFS